MGELLIPTEEKKASGTMHMTGLGLDMAFGFDNGCYDQTEVERFGTKSVLDDCGLMACQTQSCFAGSPSSWA